MSIRNRIKHRFEMNKYRRIPINAKVKIQQFGGTAVDAGCITVDSFLNKNDIVIYVAGVGEEVNFELDLLKALGREKKNVQIYAFDPTPKSAAFIQEQNLPQNFHFYPYAIVDIDKSVGFAIPQTEGWVSGTCEDVKNDERHLDFENKITVEGRSISSIMYQLGHNHIDLLKMDIEGSEFVALKDVFENNLSIDQITLDYHNYMFEDADAKLKNLLEKIQESNYAIYYVEQDNHKNHNIGLIKKDLL